jgi:hypothetical protein
MYASLRIVMRRVMHDHAVGARAKPVVISDDVAAALRTMRRAGYVLLVAALTLDVVARERDRWRRAVALRYAKWVDGVVPEEDFLLDVALALLHASGG